MYSTHLQLRQLLWHTDSTNNQDHAEKVYMETLEDVAYCQQCQAAYLVPRKHHASGMLLASCAVHQGLQEQVPVTVDFMHHYVAQRCTSSAALHEQDAAAYSSEARTAAPSTSTAGWNIQLLSMVKALFSAMCHPSYLYADRQQPYSRRHLT
jgi:hypothetical protein